MNRIELTSLDLQERLHKFDEVSKGYNREMAMEEARRCLQCKKPFCVEGCPVNLNIPAFIKEILNDDLDKGLQIINENSLFPSICGRVCPQELQCESLCIRAKKGVPVAIGKLERYIGDNAPTPIFPEIIENNIKVGIIGSGPSGLTCAYELRRMGYDVTIFEGLHTPGGVLAYGIPEFRLPKNKLNDEIKKLTDIKVKIITNTIIGKTITIEQLQKEGYQAFYIAAGAGLPKFMDIPGENLVGVFSANEYLTRINLMKAYLESSHTPLFPSKNVVVVGGGNVAMDAARCAIRTNVNKVYVVYRRTLEDMPARKEEIRHAMEEGVEFIFETNPIKIHGDLDHKVLKIECVKMQLDNIDESGRKQPIPIEGSNFFIDCDTVIMALGNTPNPIISNSLPNLNTNKNQTIIVNENMQTSIPFVFAGGDIVTGAATVIGAMGAGKKASISIDNYIKSLKN